VKRDVLDPLDRIRAERKAKGQAPTIQSPAVYRLLDALLMVRAERERQSPEND
jgi:hypothetical protein